MPVDLIRRINPDRLYMPFFEALLDVLSECRKLGRDYKATLGFRTYAEQDAIYAQGRTAPGAIVTAARGGQSAHNFGLACDFYAGDWKPESYELLGATAKVFGLVWGGDWKKPDRPHVQWPGFVTSSEMAPLRTAWGSAPGTDEERLARVWAVVEQVGRA